MVLGWLRSGLAARMPHSQGYAPLSLNSPDITEKPAVYESSKASWASGLVCILPSFAQPSSPGSERRLSRSAWLDGLRGVAAFVVVWHHSTLIYFGWDVHNAWTEEHGIFMQLPIIRLFISGIPAVCIFFVISGYAISLKLLKLSHLGRSSEFADALASSLFRRHPRLFMPATLVLLSSAVMSYFNLFATEAWSNRVAIPTRAPPHHDGLFDQLFDWAHHSMGLAYPIRNTINSRDVNPYDPNLWTLPVEFGTSMMIFTLLAVTHKFRPFVRMGFTFCLIAYFFYRTENNVVLFLCGMFLADIRTYLTLREEGRPQLPMTSSESSTPRFLRFGKSVVASRLWKSTWTRRIAALAAFVFCIYVLSIPEFEHGASGDPNFQMLVKLVPQIYHDAGRATYFWIPIGAVALVAVIDYNRFLQHLFNSRFAQYLGKISFALYLIHGPLLWSYGVWLGPRLVPTNDDVTMSQWGWGVTLCYLCFWPVAIYEADVVTRLIDMKSVTFARWVYNKLVLKA
jgi:peptidoglycan/LPS O-acetylase OafA/YrhL